MKEGPRPTNKAGSHLEKVNALRKLVQALEHSDHSGMRTSEWDAIRSALWTLATSCGAYTGPHQDAAGYLTWVKCEIGMKMWCFLEPCDDSPEVEKAMKGLHELMVSCRDTDEVQAHARPVSLILKPGTMLYVAALMVHCFAHMTCAS